MHSNPPVLPAASPDNWDDLRFVLAVAEAGTVSEAARRIGVNHATVLRRVAAFEQRHGSAIFEKTRVGYAIPPDRLRVIEALREVDRAVQAVSRLMLGNLAPLSGAIRLTSTDSLCQIALPPMLAEIRIKAPDLRFDLYSTNAHLELGRLQADITVRPALQLPDDLFGIRCAQLGFAAYTSACNDPLVRWLGIGGPSARSVASAWLDANVDPAHIVGAADSFLILREMAAAGQGRAILPCFLGDGDPRLIRLHSVVPRMSVNLWVASHVDLADTPRIRSVRDLLADALRAKAAWLLGYD